MLSLLRHKRWATGLGAGVCGSGHNNSSCCATFTVTFYLTKVNVSKGSHPSLRRHRLSDTPIGQPLCVAFFVFAVRAFFLLVFIS